MKGKTMMTAEMIECVGQVNNGRWCQETYETGSGDAGRRARQLRKMGYDVVTSAMGLQVTRVGMVKLTLVDIRPGQNVDTCVLPEVSIVNL